MVNIKKLGMSEQEIKDLESKGFGLDKKQRKLMLEMHGMEAVNISDLNELQVHFKLPEDYKNFLLENNGGTPLPNAVKTENNVRVINNFLAIKAPKGFYDTIENYLEIYKKRMPIDTIPISSAGSSDLILMKADGVGEICYWDHNFESENDEDYSDNLEVLAPNFSEFLRLIYSPEE